MYTHTHTYTAVKIGFSNSLYSVHEGKGYLTFGVELKNNTMSAVPIKFTVIDVEGGAHSKF